MWVLRSLILVGKVSGCVLILFRTTCGNGWPRYCRLLPNDAAVIPDGFAFRTGRLSPASCTS
ncbi:flagellar L-ring protein [Streptomyces azureus]|uniref:Flagellar L-ring protein n=1 Tax=Streptomyces azureus TaxID=146537 RepID=A0A0K8PK74_STRAJ|nr:flagellar L-ring protein [Streptomyces azureus]